MKQILLFFLYLLSAGSVHSNGPDSKIFVIGTIHYSTNNYNSDTLLSILNSLDPDVILVECDSSYMTHDFQLKEDISNTFLETRAITKYQKNKSVTLRPYDIAGRDDFLNDNKRKLFEYNFFRELDDLNRSNKLNNDGISILNRVLSMMNISQQMSNSAASFINSFEGSRNIDTINYYSYDGLDKLINVTPELSPYSNYWKEELEYWNKRNAVMVENILNFRTQFPGKRIVVLCGFAHKNILKNSLAEKAKEGKFEVKEYWDI